MYGLNWRKGYVTQLLLIVFFCGVSSLSWSDNSALNPWFSPAFYQAKPEYLADIQLTVEQEENLFKLLHAQLPAIRELQTERIDAAQAVQAQALIHNYDRDLLDPMIERLAKAVVAEQIQRAEIDNRIVSLLTPAQREQVIDWWQQRQKPSIANEVVSDAVDNSAESLKNK